VIVFAFGVFFAIHTFGAYGAYGTKGDDQPSEIT
jgi:hypothetical protein